MEISKGKIKLFASLSAKKHRQKEGLFMVEGTKCVLDTLSYFDLYGLIATNVWLESHSVNFPSEKLMLVSEKVMSQISSLSTPPDVIAIYQLPQWNIDETKIKNELTLILDGIQDPGNLGTIVRIADWFGIHQIIASRDTADIFNSKSIQATMGAISRVKVFYTDIVGFIKAYPTMPVYGTLLDGENIYEMELSDKGFIIMGNEGNGISAEIRSMVNQPLFIPPYPIGVETSESLNVGVATAITVAEFRRRLK